MAHAAGQAFLLERAQGGDPMKALQAEKLGLEIEDMRNPKPDADWTKLDDGRLFNQRTGETKAVGEPDGGGLFEGTSVEAQSLNYLVKTNQLTADQAAQLGAGKTVTNPADGSIMFLTPRGIFSQPAGGGPATPVEPQNVPQVTPAPQPDTTFIPGEGRGFTTREKLQPIQTTESAPAAPAGPGGRPGIIPLTEGKPGKLATESETRNRALYTVAAPDLEIALENFSELENIYSQAASKVLPWGLDNMATSPNYQRAKNAMRTIIATYLYSTSGATANPGEVENQIGVLMPTPNEAPESVADKRARLKTMVDAIRQAGGNWTPPPAGTVSETPNVRKLAPGVTIEKLN
jgi:hypothetical protein